MNTSNLTPTDSEVIVTVISTTTILPITWDGWDYFVALIVLVVIFVITVCCIILICFKNQKAKDDGARPQMSPTNSSNVVIEVDSNRDNSGVPQLKKVSHCDIDSERWIVDQVVRKHLPREQEMATQQCPSSSCSVEVDLSAPQSETMRCRRAEWDEKMVGAIDIDTRQTRINAVLNTNFMERKFKSCDPEHNAPECARTSWWDEDREERIIDEINAIIRCNGQ